MSICDELLLETNEIKDKLENIEQYMTKHTLQEAYSFARLIGVYLPEEITPEAFYTLAATTVLDAMVKGKDKEDNKILEQIQPDDIMRQQSLVLDIKTIAYAVCPVDFADCVKEYSKEMYRLMRTDLLQAK